MTVNAQGRELGTQEKGGWVTHFAFVLVSCGARTNFHELCGLKQQKFSLS